MATLGAGGMGVVHKAIDTRLNRPVAIKAIPEGLGLDTSAVLRLRAEAQAAASLDHPYICKIYELLDTDSGTLIVMEYVDGETLAALILRDGRLAVSDVLRYGAGIAEGLAAAHARGLVHRDVKPSNVMVTAHGHVKLLDFGIAHHTGTGSGNTATQSMQTRPGTVAGSPFYMAPEQALGHSVDGKTDIFALGIVLFECLTGALPFEGATRDAYVLDMLTGRPRALAALAPSVPKSLEELIASCLDRDPALRPDAATVAAYLRAHAPSGSTDRFVLPQRRSWKRLALTALAFLALTVPAAWGVYRWLVPAPSASLGQQSALITWPSEDSDPRVSPDGKWISFLSNRDGPVRLFVTSASGDAASALTDPAFTPLTHVWSQDGSEIAALVRTSAGTFVHVLSAPLGGGVRASMALNERPVVGSSGVRLLRWIGTSLYLELPSTPGLELWRIDLASTLRENVTERWSLQGSPHGYAISPNGREVVWSATADGQEDLWIATLDGQNARRLTNDRHNERLPVWSRAGTIVFQSTRSGQLDLWEIDVRNEGLRQLTSGQAEEVYGESTADGALQAFQLVSENANVWMAKPGGEHVQLTFDALSEFAPSVAATGAIVFQRSLPSLPVGNRLLDARIWSGRIDNGRLASEPTAIGDGFAPQLSPDGARLAYFQRPASTSDIPQLVLRVKDLGSGQVFTLDRPATLLTFSTVPLGWAAAGVAWNPVNGALYFASLDEKGHAVRVVGSDGFKQDNRRPQPDHIPSDVLATSGPREQLSDLCVSADGTRLSYLRFDARSVPSESRKVQLHEIDLVTGADRLVRAEPWPQGRLVTLRGWTRDGSRILLDQVRRGGRLVHVIEVKADGSAREVASLEDGYAVTARLDRQRRVLYLTRSEGSVQNIVSVSLATGEVRPLTSNQRQGISFSGMEVIADGSVVYSLDRRSADIWLIRPAEAVFR